MVGELQAGYARLKQGTLWQQFAAANPGEAARIDTYIAGFATGTKPAAPTMTTATGQGFIMMIQGGYGGA